MARAVGRPASTVQSWKDRKSIPDEHKRRVLECADQMSLGLTETDFFPRGGEEAA